jgi:hypothetical protein
MNTINCHQDDIVQGGPTKWMDLLADFIVGGHMVFTGSLTTVGITAPICIGDNIEWDGIVFQIETITHSCSIDASGKKIFLSSFALTHGINAIPPNGDLGVYAGIDSELDRDFEPGLTIEDSSYIKDTAPSIARPLERIVSPTLPRGDVGK